MADKPVISLHDLEEAGPSPLQKRLYAVIYRSDTPAGRVFDLFLIVVILAAVLAVMLESVPEYHAAAGPAFKALEWLLTALFTVEYALRLYCVAQPLRYARSFFGVVDLLSILPAYLSLLFPGAESLLVVRLLRVLRIFRILKLVRYMEEASNLLRALRQSLRKILVFYLFVLALVVIFGSVAYVVEGPANGFTSIPRSIYWAIVTVTTTGYGDITPKSALGQFLASFVMVTGYAVIAVPTGIFSAEVFRQMIRRTDERQCVHCGEIGHEPQARYCHHCGTRLP